MWQEFYELTLKRPADPSLEFALTRVSDGTPKIAVDCGCGAGRNTALLRERGFEVHGFDPDAKSGEFYTERFAGDDGVSFSQASCLSYAYPRASIVVASYSLFFCPADEFDRSWSRLTDSIVEGGVFVGTFLGPEDSWAANNALPDGAPVLVHSFEEVRNLLSNFVIEGIDIRNFDGATANGSAKHWHSFTLP